MTDIEKKVDEIEKRVQRQEHIHRNVKDDGNVYHEITINGLVIAILLSVGISALFTIYITRKT